MKSNITCRILTAAVAACDSQKGTHVHFMQKTFRMLMLPCLLFTTIGVPCNLSFAQQASTTAPSIDGFKDPTLIPDAIAFDHFFSVLRAGQSTPQAADARRRSYLRFYLRPGCGPGANEDRTLTDSQIDGLLKFVDRLDAQLKTVEQEIVLIQSQSKGPSTSSSLAALQISRTDLIKSAASSLGSELDADTARKINQHVNEHVKRQIKIYSLP